MDAESLASIVVGGVSLLGGCLCRTLSHRYQVPHFKDFSNLENHLKNAPAQRDNVLVEGRVGADPAGNTFISVETRLQGVVGLVSTTSPVKARIGNSEREEWCDLTEEKMTASTSFKLWDIHGCSILVKSVGNARGLRKLLEMVYEPKPAMLASEKGSGVASSEEVLNRALPKDYLLLFGTSLAGYGEAVLSQDDGPVLFTPTEVGHSVKDLHYPKMKATALKFFSVMLFVAGGTMIVIGVIPLIKRLFPKKHVREPMIQQQSLLTLDGTTIEQSVEAHTRTQGGEPGNEAKQQPHRR